MNQEKAFCQRDAFYCTLKWERRNTVKTGTVKKQKSKEKRGKSGLRDVRGR